MKQLASNILDNFSLLLSKTGFIFPWFVFIITWIVLSKVCGYKFDNEDLVGLNTLMTGVAAVLAPIEIRRQVKMMEQDRASLAEVNKKLNILLSGKKKVGK